MVIKIHKGDSGFTKYKNGKIIKSEKIFYVLGNIDELSSFLGLIYHDLNEKDIITQIQKVLENINFLIAKDIFESNDKIFFNENDVKILENLTPNIKLNAFILPGSSSSKLGAKFDFARAICRRAERDLILYIKKNKKTNLNLTIKYLNRLSDFLFYFARNLKSKY